MNSDCLFCKIIDGKIPADIVHEDDQVLAFKDISPQAPFHSLIIPKIHINTINNLDTSHQTLLGHILLTAKKIAVDNGLSEPGYRLIMNCNEDGGQTVFHIHIHILGGRPLIGFG
ncbi:MAG: histidine triad nucleotide-binding protein [Pseudomonadales bacterium]|nr:histidine triad nucleotide-binding protein [Pseudomonadales bacterium]